MCLGASTLRKKRRLSLNALKKINGRPVVWHGFRGGIQSCSGGKRKAILCRKADEGAEKSCPSRRRQRGLRVGKRRSRGGKPPRTVSYPALDANPMSSRRKLRRFVRESAWAEKVTRAIWKLHCSLQDKFQISRKGRLFIDPARVKAFRCECRRRLEQLSRMARRPITVSDIVKYMEKPVDLPDGFAEIGFGWPEQSPRERLLSRCLHPSIEDLFPDSGPISLARWYEIHRVRLDNVKKLVVPCRCRGPHRWCEDCGGCIYGGTIHHRPVARPRRAVRQ